MQSVLRTKTGALCKISTVYATVYPLYIEVMILCILYHTKCNYQSRKKSHVTIYKISESQKGLREGITFNLQLIEPGLDRFRRCMQTGQTRYNQSDRFAVICN